MPAVVDSSGWIEYFTDGPNVERFAGVITDVDALILPSIIITEVYRWVMREAGASDALAVAALMKQGKVVPLDDRLAVLAAETSHRHRLPLAGGVIYTTAQSASAELLTQDSDLEGLPGVTYIAHPKRKS